MPICTNRETLKQIDEDGQERTTIKEKTTNIERSNEPDYIKIYTKMWFDFNNIPLAWQPLFLQLASRMSYCNFNDRAESGGQLVNTGRPWADGIMQTLNIKPRQYQKGLAKLCEVKAIKKISRGVYQVNPSYCGRGEWKYNPRLERGGVENLVATFDFLAGTVSTQVVWADNGQDTPQNASWREGMGVQARDETVLISRTVKPQPAPEEVLS